MIITSDYDTSSLEGASDQAEELLYSDSGPTNSTWCEEETRDQRVVLATYSVLLLVGGTGNLGVLCALTRLRRRWSRVDLMMTHLAVADICVTCGLIPLEASGN